MYVLRITCIYYQFLALPLEFSSNKRQLRLTMSYRNRFLCTSSAYILWLSPYHIGTIQLLIGLYCTHYLCRVSVFSIYNTHSHNPYSLEFWVYARQCVKDYILVNDSSYFHSFKSEKICSVLFFLSLLNTLVHQQI